MSPNEDLPDEEVDVTDLESGDLPEAKGLARTRPSTGGTRALLPHNGSDDLDNGLALSARDHKPRPRPGTPLPAAAHVAWHGREVSKGTALAA